MALDVRVRITAGVEADELEPLVKIKPDGACVAGLRLKNYRAAVLFSRDVLCKVHKPPADALPAKIFRDP